MRQIDDKRRGAKETTYKQLRVGPNDGLRLAVWKAKL